MIKVKFVKEYVHRNGNSGAHFTIPIDTIAMADDEQSSIEELASMGHGIWVEDFQPVVYKGNTDNLDHCFIPPEYLEQID